MRSGSRGAAGQVSAQGRALRPGPRTAEPAGSQVRLSLGPVSPVAIVMTGR